MWRCSNRLKYACYVTLVCLLAGCSDEQRAVKVASKPQGQKVDPRVRVLLDQTQRALSEFELQEALSYLDQADRYQPGLPEAAFLRGHVALAMKRFPAARSAFESILKRYPTYEAAWHSLGDVAYAEGAYREAIRYYEREEAINPTPQSWYNIGNAYRMLKRPDSALAAFAASTAIEPTYAPALYAVAEVLENRGDFDAALESASKALAIDPDNADYRYLVGQLYFRTNRLDEAESNLQRVIEVAPWHYSALYTLGQVMQRQGRSAEAGAMLNRAEEARQRQAEIRQAERNTSMHGDSAGAHVALAEDLIRAGRLDEALERFNLALALDPGNLLIEQNIASLTLAKGKTEAAMMQCLEIIRRDSARVGAWVILSAAYARLGRTKESEQAWSRAFRLDPNHPTVQQALRKN